MKQTYNALILEDNEVDASLLENYLCKSSKTFDVEWVRSGAEYENRILSLKPDVIITDYRLKDYSGYDALKFRNVHCEKIPFVIVSGHIGEEKAAQLIKEGATDFLMKNNAENALATTVLRAINEFHEKEMNRVLKGEASKSQMLLETITKHAVLPVWIREPDGKFYFVNKQFREIFNVDDDVQIIGKKMEDILDEETAAQFSDNDKKVIERNEPILIEEKVSTADGVRYYQSNLFPITELPDIEFAIGGLAIDITYHHEYEKNLQNLYEMLQKYTRELEVSNTELEQFAYMTSHDLQEPLRMITSFMELLKTKYGDKLDEKAHQYIHYAIDGAIRMREVILDLLEYSRVGKNEEDKEWMDVNEIVEFVCQMQYKIIKEKKAEIEIGDLPEVLSYRAPLIQIFQNLIGNSLKYSKSGQAPNIKISSEEEDSEWVFIVKDNGIGINPDYFEKIFIIFQRLHTNEEYEGSGIGLTIVKKIIDNIKGRIWVESKEGEGSTFYFTIPKSE